MKSTLLKSIVTTVAIGITMALTSVVAMAAGTAPSKDSNGVWTYTINGVATAEDLSTAGFELAGGHSFEVKDETAGTAFKLSKPVQKQKV
ncbi:MAG: hypothetical protein IJ736_14660 [Firmicutes bacterium]|nr:hypothetical protein [Bacillota bacterium]